MFDHKNFHTLRDFYWIAKSFGQNFKKDSWANSYDSRQIYHIIDKHFSGIYYVRERAYNPEKVHSNSIFKRIFYAQSRELDTRLLSEGPEYAFSYAYNPLDYIKTAMRTPRSRFLMLFLDCEITRFLLIDQLPRIMPQNDLDSAEPRSLEMIEGSKFQHDTQNQKYYFDILSQIKVHIEKGDFLVLSDLDNIYGILYDLFNQRFSMEENSSSVCQINYGDMKEKIPIHSSFGCIMLKSESDFLGKKDIEKKLPSPLLNRFEKHILTLENYTSHPDTKEAIDFVKEFIKESLSPRYLYLSGSRRSAAWQELGNRLIHCFHDGQLIDYICIKLQNGKIKYDHKKSQLEKYKVVFVNLVRFFSSKMMVLFFEHLRKQASPRVEMLTVSYLTWFKNLHSIESLEGVLARMEQKDTFSRWIVFTFCNYFYLPASKRSSPEEYMVLDSKSLEIKGFSQLDEKLEKLQEDEGESKKGLIIVIENTSQFHHLKHLEKYINKFVQTSSGLSSLRGKSIGIVVHQINANTKLSNQKLENTSSDPKNKVFYPNSLIENKIRTQFSEDCQSWEVYYIDNLKYSYFE